MGHRPADAWIDAIGTKAAELGFAAPFIYVALYIAGTVMLAPSPLMSIAAGVAFGSAGGVCRWRLSPQRPEQPFRS